MTSHPVISPRKQPQQERSKVTVDVLLQAAAQLLTEVGYDKLTTNLIAARAGVSIGSLYQYFPSKEAIVSALCEDQLAKNFLALADQTMGIAELSLREAIDRFVQVLFQFHIDRYKLYLAFLEQVPKTLWIKVLREGTAALAMIIHAYFRRQPDLRLQDPESAAFLLSYGIQSMVYGIILEHPEGLKNSAFAQEITDMLTRYLVREETLLNPQDATQESGVAGDPQE